MLHKELSGQVCQMPQRKSLCELLKIDLSYDMDTAHYYRQGTSQLDGGKCDECICESTWLLQLLTDTEKAPQLSRLF